jgi:hypothetical protein
MQDGPLNDYQYYFVISHELGHAFGLYHAPGCNAEGYDPLFPYLGSLPSNAGDSVVTQTTATTTSGPTGNPSVTSIPKRGTIGGVHGGTNGYQLYSISNVLSKGLIGVMARNQIGYVYNAATSLVIGPGAGELAINSFNSPASPNTQTYDVMGYCSAYYYNKWISDYDYWRVAKFTQQRMHGTTGNISFDDLANTVPIGW